MKRKNELISGQIYHIFNRSIADFTIFNNQDEFSRIVQLIQYYQTANELKFSKFMELEAVGKFGFDNFLQKFSKDEKQLVQIIAYCIMPTHFHLILKQITENGISLYLRDFQNSYSHYFNTKHKRKGPLWESKFKNVLVKNDEYLFHLTRYLHLNPVTAFLVDRPEDWPFSSYKEYMSEGNQNEGICRWDGILDIKPLQYRTFVNDQIAYQRELGRIKKLLLE